jgi:hypothetical protein
MEWAEMETAEPSFTPYLYPPLWAALVAPIAERTTATGFFNGTLIVLAGSTIWMVWLSNRLIGACRVRPSIWASVSIVQIYASDPGVLCYWLGQPQVLVSAITLAAAVALSRGRDITAGGLLALAAAAKLSPALLIVLFVMEGRWRALGAFAVVGVVIGGLSILLAGWPLHAELLAKLSLIEERILFSHILVSLELVLYQIAELVTGGGLLELSAAQMVREPAWITLVLRAFLVAGVFATWWTTRRIAGQRRIWARFFALTLVTLLASPLGWVHYLILPIALLPGLFEVMDRRAATLAVGLLFAPLSLTAIRWLAEVPNGDAIQFALFTTCAFAMLAVVLTVAHRLSKP